MTSRSVYHTTYDVENAIHPVYTGGRGGVALDGTGRILASSLGEDVLLTDLSTGNQLAKIDGVCKTPASQGLLILFTTDPNQDGEELSALTRRRIEQGWRIVKI